jgi:uncharacterized protein
MVIVLETMRIKGIPVLVLAPEDARHRPLIIYIPGYGATKESGLSLGYRLARQGFLFLSFDPWLHGERYEARLDHADEPALGGVYPPATGLDTGITFYTVIQWCLLDIQTLIAHFTADPRADTTRCGVTGPSMGGCASYLAFADIPQIQAAVPMIGIPTFTQRWLDILDECALSNPEWAAALVPLEAQTAENTAFIREMDPVDRLRKAAPRALLAMNCDFDTDQPKHYAVGCFRDLKPYYEVWPDHLRLAIYPAGHVVTEQMEKDAAAWFSRHLAY